MATTIIAGSSAKPLMKMKPKPSTMFSAPGSTGPIPRSLNSGNSTAPTTIIPATRHAARNPNRITNSRPINAKVQIHSLGVADTQLPHPLMSQVKSRGVREGFLAELQRTVSGADRARVEAEPRDVGQQALIRGFTHVRRFVWGCPGLRSDVDLAIGHTG